MDTTVSIKSYKHAFLQRFGSGDSLSRFFLDDLKRTLSDRYTIVERHSVEYADWHINLKASIVSGDNLGVGIGGSQSVPGLVLHVEAMNLGAAASSSYRTEFSSTNRQSGTDAVTLGLAATQVRKELNEKFENILTAALLAEDRKKPKPPRFLVYEQPLKFALWAKDIPTWRLSVARQDGKNIYTGKISGFYTPHEIIDQGGGELERPYRLWMRFGGGLRRVANARGGGPFWEGNINFVRWRFREEIDTVSFSGAQLYNYVGYNYLGERMFFSLGIGTGLNVGSLTERNSTNSDNPLAPSIVRYMPFSPLGGNVSLDLELALGVFF